MRRRGRRGVCISLSRHGNVQKQVVRRTSNHRGNNMCCSVVSPLALSYFRLFPIPLLPIPSDTPTIWTGSFYTCGGGARAGSRCSASAISVRACVHVDVGGPFSKAGRQIDRKVDRQAGSLTHGQRDRGRRHAPAWASIVRNLVCWFGRGGVEHRGSSDWTVCVVVFAVCVCVHY